MVETDQIEVEYTACRVCGNEPEVRRIPPVYVYSLDEDDRDEKEVRAIPFGESVSKPFACSDACFNQFIDDNPEFERRVEQ